MALHYRFLQYSWFIVFFLKSNISQAAFQCKFKGNVHCTDKTTALTHYISTVILKKLI